jgi:hypothetical protein
MGRKITVTADVEIPLPANFLRFNDGSGTIDIADVDDEGLRAIGAAYTVALIENAHRRRIAKSGQN